MATTATEVQAVECLDGDLWSKLPEDVVVSIVARLPLRELARYRTVCKKWQGMWYSPSFLQLRSECSHEKPWFIFNRQEGVLSLGTRHRQGKRHRNRQPDSPCLCYNPGVNKWHALTFNNLPSSVDRVAATAGGLMFCVKKPNVIRMRIAVVFWSWPVMIVCNPLKENCYTQIPGRHCNWKPHTIGMVVDSKTNSFKIVLATVHQGTEIYDSRMKTWKLLEFCRPPGLSIHPEAISHKGFIYSVGINFIFVFDVEKEIWSWVDLPHPEREIRNTQLYECQGRLLLVGCLRSGDAADEARMLVWEQVGETSSRDEWKELSSVSVAEVRTAFRPGMEKYGGQDDLLFVRGEILNLWELPHVGGGCHQSLVASGAVEEVNEEPVYLYSLSRKKWYLVDESPIYSQRLTKYEGAGLRFEPKIEASI